MRFPTFNMQDATFDVGRFGRAPIEVHAGFFFVALALTFQFWSRYTLANLLLALIGITVIFGSILIHELAHAVFARRYGVPVSRIDIHIFGGTVSLGFRPAKVSQDLAITFAGPASNLILGTIFFLLLLLLPDNSQTGHNMLRSGFDPISFIDRALTFAMYLNLGVGLINLLPAFPLDGGWMSYRVLTQRFGRRHAGIAVASLGIVFAALSSLVFIASMFAGMAIYSPPDFRSNLDALQSARRGDPILI